MTPDETLRELNVCVNDWKGFLANKNATLRGNLIAWPNYLPHIEKNITRDAVTALAGNRQYSFQLLDGSIIQLVYDFSGPGSKLASATLAYYENIVEDGAQEDAEEGAEDEAEEKIVPVEDPPPLDSPKWIRIDFREGQQTSAIHTDCHLHLSGFPETRIACSGVPGPRQFLESLLAWLYPERYRARALENVNVDLALRAIDVNRVCIKLTPPQHFNSLLHLALPPSVRFPEGRADAANR